MCKRCKRPVGPGRVYSGNVGPFCDVTSRDSREATVLQAALAELNRCHTPLFNALGRFVADVGTPDVQTQAHLLDPDRIVLTHDVALWHELHAAHAAWTKAHADYCAAALAGLRKSEPPLPTEALLAQLDAERGNVIPVDFRPPKSSEPVIPAGSKIVSAEISVQRLLHKYKPGDRLTAAMDITYAHSGVEIPEGSKGTAVGSSFDLTIGFTDAIGNARHVETQTGLVLVKWDGIEDVLSTSADSLDPIDDLGQPVRS